MACEQPRLSSGITRLLLDQAVEARQEYLDYLHTVASGARRPDAEERERLHGRCEAALQAWRQAHLAWRRNDPPVALAPQPGLD